MVFDIILMGKKNYIYVYPPTQYLIFWDIDRESMVDYSLSIVVHFSLRVFVVVHSFGDFGNLRKHYWHTECLTVQAIN